MGVLYDNCMGRICVWNVRIALLMFSQWCWVFFELGSSWKARKIVSLTVKSSFQVQSKCPTLPANCPPPHPPPTSIASLQCQLSAALLYLYSHTLCDMFFEFFNFLFPLFLISFPFFLLTWEMNLIFKLNSATLFVIPCNSHILFNTARSIEKISAIRKQPSLVINYIV